MNTKSHVGIVVIGRNEGERLKRCLRSIIAQATPMGRPCPLVYVDSGSTDGSLEFAAELGVETVSLDMAVKFTAARARNSGLARLRKRYPDCTYVQFVDGDCELADGWLTAATQRLDADESLAVVCGRRRERFPQKTTYNRLCDLEWDTPVGRTKSCGGDALMRVHAVEQVGGYRETLIAGEEPDLCIRLRDLGYGVERIDHEMTLHDADMTEFGQWFKRAWRSGHASAERSVIHKGHPEKPGAKQTASNLVWGLGLPAAAAVTSAVGAPSVALALGTGAYSLLFFKSYRHERRRREKDDARIFAAACVAGKVPEALGASSYFLNRFRGRDSQILEYKRAPSD